MSVAVQPVASRRDLKEFIELPYRLHSTSGVWVPPLRLERRVFLNRRLNAFFSHGDAQLFVAWRDSRVVGRISAHYDDAFNTYHGNRWGMFGFLEMEDDPEILPRCSRPRTAGCAPTGATTRSARWTSRSTTRAA